MTSEHDDAEPADILLVEDNPGDVRLTKEAFKDGKVANTLHVVENGVDALGFLFQRNDYADAPCPDLVLLDLNLPPRVAARCSKNFTRTRTADASRSLSSQVRKPRWTSFDPTSCVPAGTLGSQSTPTNSLTQFRS